MYEQHFGLLRRAFDMTPDPDFLFMTHTHVEALAGLTYAILRQKGFVVLTGEAGTGKTTVITVTLKHIGPQLLESSVIFNPTLTPNEFLESVLLDFGFSEVPGSKPQRLQLLQNFLLRCRQQKKACVLVVDEAHKLSLEVLEEIRLLTNFEMADGKLLQIVLAGQPELTALLNRDDLRQLKQRVAVRLNISALEPGQVNQYIQYRWAKAGAKPSPFDADAITEIARYSRGIPRVLNAVCDNALALAFAAGDRVVRSEHIREVAADLQLGYGLVPPPPRPDLGIRSRQPAGGTQSEVAALPSLERYTRPQKPSRLEAWGLRWGVSRRKVEQNL